MSAAVLASPPPQQHRIGVVKSPSAIYSSGQLARRFGKSVRQVQYATKLHGVPTIGQIGRLFIYDEQGARLLGAALRKVAANRAEAGRV